MNPSLLRCIGSLCAPLLMGGIFVAPAVSAAPAPGAAADPELARQAQIIVSSRDATERQLAMLKVYNRELFIELAQQEPNAEVRRTAILLLDDQPTLLRLATDPQVKMRTAAIMGIEDETFLLARVMARDESSPSVRSAIVAVLKSEAAMAQAAQTAYYSDVRMAARNRLTDRTLANQVRIAQAAIDQDAVSLGLDESPVRLVEQAVRGKFDTVAQGAARRLTRREDLTEVALAAGDREVLKIVLAKIDDPPSLQQIAAGAAEAPMRLAAACKAGLRTWAEIFGGSSGSSNDARVARGNALAAVSLFNSVQPDALATVQQTCVAMIHEGDESHLPEMSDLLMLYGDTPLVESYLSNGQPDWAAAGQRWATTHGYSVSRVNGFTHVNVEPKPFAPGRTLPPASSAPQANPR